MASSTSWPSLPSSNEELKSLSVEESAGFVLERFHPLTKAEHSGNFAKDVISEFPKLDAALLRQVLMEGWQWLESHGMIAPTGEHPGWYFVTRLGHEIGTAKNLKTYLSGPQHIESQRPASTGGQRASGIKLEFGAPNPSKTAPRPSLDGSPIPTAGSEKTRDSSSWDIAARALADKPSTNDLLGFDSYADAIADFIKNPKTEKPLTIAIDAPWGMGKSTLMRMIGKRLTPDAKDLSPSSMCTVYFNAWKYAQDEALWAALAIEILRQVRQQLNLRRRARLWWLLNWYRFDWNRFGKNIITRLGFIAFMWMLGVLTLVLLKWLGAPLPGWSRLLPYIMAPPMVAAVYALGKATYRRIIAPFDLKLSEYLRKPDYRKRIGFLAEFEEDFRRVVRSITTSEEPLVIYLYRRY